MTPRIACQRDCPDGCVLLLEGTGPEARVRGDPSHPVTRGFTCMRALRFPRYYASGRRVLYPHVREGDAFRRVSWEEALDLVASRLREVLDERGPESVLFFNYAGNSGLISFNYPLRLCHALGATRLEYTICDEAGELAIELHYGMRYGAFPQDMEGARLLVIWGANLASSSVHAYRIASDLRARGARIWIVDPRRTKTTLLGKHVRPRPGTDAVLAAGISWYIINELGVDRDFIDRYTKGFEEYAELISRFRPDLVEEVTGVDRGTLRELAEDYVTLRPSVTYIGVGMQKTRWGAEAVRVIALIPALVGVHRGFYFCNSCRDLDIAYLQGRHLGEARRVNMLDVPRLLSEGRFGFVYIYGSNPAVTLPRADLFREGLSRDDVFAVVHEVVWTETAQLSDVVLPATGMFEHEEVVGSWWHQYLAHSQPAWQPMGESRPNWWVIQQLSKRLGLGHEALYEDPMEAMDGVLRRSEMTGHSGLEELRRRGWVELRYPPKDEYQTPSGRIEFFSSRAEEIGLSPLPKIGWDQQRGFILITSSVPERTATQDLLPEDLAELDRIHISEEDARQLGIRDGDVILISGEGEALAQVEIDHSLPRGVLWARRNARFMRGFVNDVLTWEKQEIGGGNAMNSSMVMIALEGRSH